jgi:hypothetical protein
LLSNEFFVVVALATDMRQPKSKNIYFYRLHKLITLHSLNKIIETLISIVLINKGLLRKAIFMPYLGNSFFFSDFSKKKNIQVR